MSYCCPTIRPRGNGGICFGWVHGWGSVALRRVFGVCLLLRWVVVAVAVAAAAEVTWQIHETIPFHLHQWPYYHSCLQYPPVVYDADVAAPGEKHVDMRTEPLFLWILKILPKVVESCCWKHYLAPRKDVY